MEFNETKDQLISKSVVRYNDMELAVVTLYKAEYNKDKPYSNIDILPNFNYDLPNNLGNDLSKSISDYNIVNVLTALNTDFTTLETIDNKLYNNIKAIYNRMVLTDDIINKVLEILNYTLEDEELGIYNDFSYYYFNEDTLNRCLLWCLKECPMFIDMTDKEIIKVIVHYFIKSWLQGRYEIKEMSSKTY